MGRLNAVPRRKEVIRVANMIAEDQIRANAFDVLSAANESIYHSGSAFEAEYHKGRVAAVEQLLVKLGVPQQEVEGLKVEACQDYE
jgi:hypothetical protein